MGIVYIVWRDNDLVCNLIFLRSFCVFWCIKFYHISHCDSSVYHLANENIINLLEIIIAGVLYCTVYKLMNYSYLYKWQPYRISFTLGRCFLSCVCVLLGVRQVELPYFIFGFNVEGIADGLTSLLTILCIICACLVGQKVHRIRLIFAV